MGRMKTGAASRWIYKHRKKQGVGMQNETKELIKMQRQ